MEMQKAGHYHQHEEVRWLEARCAELHAQMHLTQGGELDQPAIDALLEEYQWCTQRLREVRSALWPVPGLEG